MSKNYVEEVQFTCTHAEYATLRNAIRKVVDNAPIPFLSSAEYSAITELYDIVLQARTIPLKEYD